MMIGSHLGLWRNVTSSNHPKELIDYDLKEGREAIAQGILSYEKVRNEKSAKELKSKKFGANQLQFVLELSELLNLDELLCQKLFSAWLVNEYRESPEHLKTCLADERSRYGLLERLVAFYYTDRMYCHLVLREIVCNSYNPHHSHQLVFSDFLKELESKASGRIYKLLIGEYDTLYNMEPVELYNSPLRHIMTGAYLSSWCYKVLKERILALETLLIYLYYNRSTSSAQSYLHELLSKFKTDSITGQAGLKQLIEDVHRPLLERLEQLQVLVILTLMNLEESSSADHPLNEETPLLSKLSALFETRLGDFTSHGPLVLGWAVIRCGQVSPDVIGKLGDVALGTNVLSYILQMLNQLEPQEVSNQLSFITIYHLIARVLELFDDLALDDGTTLTEIVCRLLEHESISDLIIQERERCAVYRYLLSALSTFPEAFYPTLCILSALAASSKQAAMHVVGLLLDVPTFTECLGVDSPTKLQFINDREVELLENRKIFGSVELPVGTVGTIYGADGPPTVQWQHPYNAWDLLSYELVVTCDQMYVIGSVKTQERLLCNIRLMAVTFKHAPISGPPAERIHDSLYRILHGLASLEAPPLDTLAACIDLSASLALFAPATVVENLCIGFLPFLLNPDTDLHSPWEARIEKSLLGQVLYSAECTAAKYPVLISTLKMVCSTLQSSQQSHSQIVRLRLLPVVLYVLRDVLTSYNGWRYIDVTERDTIGELCIEMINIILNTVSKPVDEDQLRKACVRTLLHTNSAHSLLDMITFGAEMLDSVILEQYGLQVRSCLVKEGRPSTVYKLELCLSILHRLLNIAQGTKEDTALESCLSTKANQSQRHISRVVASFTYHRHHTKLSVVSTQLLNVIAQESQMSLLSSFGEESYSIRSGLIRRLAQRSEDPNFKVVLVELLTTCVENQPGLLELFLSTKGKGERPLLEITQQMIEADRQFTHLCPGDLLLAGLNFVLALWTSGRQRITQQLAVSKSFWKTVTAPLTNPLGNMGSDSDSHPIKAKLYCNVLQLLSYQLYQRDSSAKEFQSVLASVTQPQWVGVSTFLHEELMAMSDTSATYDQTLRQSASIHLLDSYRMFLSTMWLAKSSLHKPETCVTVMNHVLDTLTQTMTLEMTHVHHRLTSMLSSLYFDLLTKWHSHLKDWEPSYDKLTQVLHSSTNGGSDMQLLPSTLVGIVASLQLLTSHKMKVQRRPTSTSDSTQSMLSCVCNLLPACNMQLSSISSPGAEPMQVCSPKKDAPIVSSISVAPLQQLRVVLLSALFELIDKLPESVWISRLHESYVMYSLLGSMCQSIKTHTDISYVESCVALLTKLSTKLSTSKLIAQPLSEHLTLAVTSLYTSTPPGGTGDVLTTATSSNAWHRVLAQITDVYCCLLDTLTHGFVADAASFVAVHSDRILLLSETMSITVHPESMLELRSYVHLLARLSKHQHQWMSESSNDRVKQFLVAVCYLSQDCVALLHRPKAIQLMLFKQSKRKTDEKPDSIDISHTRHSILDVLSECCLVMKSFTPDLPQLLNDVTFDVMSYEPLVTYGLSHPALENKAAPSFGSFISTMTLCISLLTKSERSPSRSQLSDDEVETIRPKLLYILEITLYLIMSQVLLYLRADVLGPRETNILKRDISSELNVCITGIQRYYRKLNPPSPSHRGAATPGISTSTSSLHSSSSTKSPRARSMHSPAFPTNLAEHGLYKLADQFVKNILK